MKQLFPLRSPVLRASSVTATALAAVSFLGLPAGAAPKASTKAALPKVEIVAKDADRRVDVLVDGKPFTSYIYPTTLKKPVLYPIRTDMGALLTRGFPMDPRPDDSKDHPHHVGLWFNHGDVDGADFWNNSDAMPEKDKPHAGTILHKGVKSAKGGNGSGRLVVDSDWVMPDGKIALREKTEFTFGAGEGRRSIDRVATLTATAGAVHFNDSKEGVLGLRLAHSLELPRKKAQEFKDAKGVVEKVANSATGEATGQYLSSEGKLGDDVWGTRARWVILTGTLEGQPVTIAIFDHPKNPTYPTFWHARNYGLFAANPFGQKQFPGNNAPLNYTIDPGKSTRLAYRVLVLSHGAKADEVEAEYKRFLAEVK